MPITSLPQLCQASSGPGSVPTASPAAALSAVAPIDAVRGDATDEGLEAAVAAEVDAASGLTVRLRELCAL